MSLWMASRAKPFSLSCPVEFISHRFNLLSVEKLFGVAVLRQHMQGQSIEEKYLEKKKVQTFFSQKSEKYMQYLESKDS